MVQVTRPTDSPSLGAPAGRRAEDLPEREDRFRRIFEDSPTGIWLVDGDLRTLEVNAAMCRILGYTTKEFAGRSFTDVTHPDDIEADLARFGQLVAGEISSYELEKRHVTKSGDPVWVDLAVTAVRDDTGGFRYAVGVVHDIGERRAAPPRPRPAPTSGGPTSSTASTGRSPAPSSRPSTSSSPWCIRTTWPGCRPAWAN